MAAALIRAILGGSLSGKSVYQNLMIRIRAEQRGRILQGRKPIIKGTFNSEHHWKEGVEL